MCESPENKAHEEGYKEGCVETKEIFCNIIERILTKENPAEKLTMIEKFIENEKSQAIRERG